MRMNCISIAKGISIILMVFAHARFSQFGGKYVNMFHMPLFFFFSGYCFKTVYLNNSKNYLSKRIKGVYFPFVKWNILFILLHNVFFYLNIYNSSYGFRGNVSSLYSWQDIGVRILHTVTRLSDYEQLLGGFWFLESLFWASLIAYCVIRWIKRTEIGALLVLILCSFALYFNKYIPYFEIGGRDFLAAFFIIFGYWYRQKNYCIEDKRLVIVIGLLIVLIGSVYWQCSMLSVKWFWVFPYVFSAIAGTFAVFSISKYLSKKDNVLKKTLVYIGDHTLIILALHFLCFKLASLFILQYLDEPVEKLAEFPILDECAFSSWWILYSIIGIALPLLIGAAYDFMMNIVKEKFYATK